MTAIREAANGVGNATSRIGGPNAGIFQTEGSIDGRSAEASINAAIAFKSGGNRAARHAPPIHDRGQRIEPPRQEDEAAAEAPAIPAPESSTPKLERKPSRPQPFDVAPKKSRRTPASHTRLHMNLGQEMGVTRDDIIRAIQGETGLPASAIGEIDLRERHAFVDVQSDHAPSVASKLNRANLKGKRLKVKTV